MQKKSPKNLFSFSGILCTTMGHNYIITRKITNHINEYECAHCGKEVTNNFKGHLENLTFKNKAANASLASFFEKKRRRTVAV